jgi:hypothetical protein
MLAVTEAFGVVICTCWHMQPFMTVWFTWQTGHMLLCYSMGGLRLGQLGGELKYCQEGLDCIAACQLPASGQWYNLGVLKKMKEAESGAGLA